jgi:plasmid stabilization system protein ParE
VSQEVRLRPEAEDDLAEAAAWYEDQRQGLGQEFLDHVLSTVESIIERPKMYPTVHRNTRRALIHRFPFGIYYRIEKELIVVVGVMHGRRDPHVWKERT